ncbi:hypothetical protein D3C86_2169830 [compost metagenome]
MRQIIRVYADTMTANQAWLIFQKVPLGACRGYHISSINIQFIKYQGQLVHKRNVYIALCIFYRL